MLTLEKLIAEMTPIHNDICIMSDSELVRLVGVAEDDEDFYYIVRGLNYIHNTFKSKSPFGDMYASAAGHLVSLKGKIPDERYAHMDELFTWNGASPSHEFIVRRI